MGNNKELELDVNIIYFDINKIKLYSMKHNMIFNLNLIHNAIKKITNTNINCNELQIELNNDDNDDNDDNNCDNGKNIIEIVKFKLFQQIKIKIYKFNSSIQPFKIDILEPMMILI